MRVTNPHFSAGGGAKASSSSRVELVLSLLPSTKQEAGDVAGSFGVDHQLRASRGVFGQLHPVTGVGANSNSWSGATIEWFEVD